MVWKYFHNGLFDLLTRLTSPTYWNSIEFGISKDKIFPIDVNLLENNVIRAAKFTFPKLDENLIISLEFLRKKKDTV